MGVPGSPSNALSLDRRVSECTRYDDWHMPQSRNDSWSASTPRRVSLPPRVRAPPPLSPIPTFMEAPPPPPIPELSPVIGDASNNESGLLRRSSAIRRRPQTKYRRRAKTPVHMIGQLESAQRQANAGVNRMSSVSTIARQYRELVNYQEEFDIPEESYIPEVPQINPKYFQQTLSKAERQAAELHFPNESRVGGQLEPPQRRSQLTPSLVSDDDDTLVTLEEYTTSPEPFSKPFCISPPPVSAPGLQDMRKTATPSTLSFQIGFEFLTAQLSSAFANQSSQDSNNTSGLQVWVMIEAYERLRDQIIASGTENQEAKSAIDSWLEALRAIHRSIVDEAAGSESDYEDEPVSPE